MRPFPINSGSRGFTEEGRHDASRVTQPPWRSHLLCRHAMSTGSADPFYIWAPGAPPRGFACYPGASAASRRRRGEVAACYLARGAPPLLLPGRARPARGVPRFRALGRGLPPAKRAALLRSMTLYQVQISGSPRGTCYPCRRGRVTRCASW